MVNKLNFYFFTEYYEFFFYFFFTFIVSSLILFLCYLITVKNPSTEKNFGYECGFDPFSDARSPFNVKFYLVSIVFIIFDIEVAFFFPFAISLKEILWFGYFSMYGFIFILLVGFLYEWKKGSLDWS